MAHKIYKKAQRKEFVEGILNILGNGVESAASKNESARDQNEVWFHGAEDVWFHTKFGPLEIRGITASKEVLSIFQAFRDKSQFSEARKQFGDVVNPYTGKWNFHLTDGENIQETLDAIKHEWESAEIGERYDEKEYQKFRSEHDPWKSWAEADKSVSSCGGGD